MKKNLFPIAIAMLCVTAPATAQEYEMKIQKTNGTVTTIDASEVQKVTFAQKPFTAEAIPTGTDLYTWFENNKVVFDTYDNVIFPLEAEGSYTQSGVIEIPNGKKAQFVGEAGKNATIEFTADAGFVVGNAFSVKNVDVNAAKSANAFISLNATPDEALLGASGKGSSYNIMGTISIENSKVTGLQSRIFYDNVKKYALETFVIDNCVFELATPETNNVSGDAYISAYGGCIVDNTIKNSTFYNTGAGKAKYFMRYSNGDRSTKVGLYTNDYVRMQNCTFYNLLPESGQFLNVGGIKGQKSSVWVYTNDIFVNCSKEVARRAIGDRIVGPVTMENNTYMRNYDGGEPIFEELTVIENEGTPEEVIKEPSYDKSGTVIGTAPTFKDAAAGDFTLGTDCEQYKKKTGDPRWIITSEAK